MNIELDALRDIAVDLDNDQPLNRQLYHAIKQRILTGRLTSGCRLASSRSISIALGISRNTVNHALDQLKAEGYLIAIAGTGHFVSTDLPDTFFHAGRVTPPKFKTLVADLPRVAEIQDLSVNTIEKSFVNSSFAVGIPDLSAFPIKSWGRIYQSNSQRVTLLGFHCPQGYPPLRQVLAQYLRASRGVICHPEQIIITAGAQQAISILTQVLLEKGDKAYIENPGYTGIRKVFDIQGIQSIGIPVGDKGIAIEALPQNPQGKILCLTPTHQYPMGGIIPLANRLDILQWAADNGIWIIEDDYDSEYHYDQKPIAAMQGLGLQDQVIYIGSFSKVLYPGLRLGYMVVPEKLTPLCTKVKDTMAGQTPIIEQATIAEFMQTGQFVRHIQKMRILYQKKLEAIVSAHKKHLETLTTLIYTGAGMHVVLLIKQTPDRLPLTDVDITNELKTRGVHVNPLSTYYIGDAENQGLILGFCNTEISAMERNIITIRRAIEALL